jgi:hypothetical protein
MFQTFVSVILFKTTNYGFLDSVSNCRRSLLHEFWIKKELAVAFYSHLDLAVRLDSALTKLTPPTVPPPGLQPHLDPTTEMAAAEFKIQCVLATTNPFLAKPSRAAFVMRHHNFAGLSIIGELIPNSRTAVSATSQEKVGLFTFLLLSHDASSTP